MNGEQSQAIPKVEWEDILRIVDAGICNLEKTQLKPKMYKLEYVMASMQAQKEILATLKKLTYNLDIVQEANLRLAKALALEAMQDEANGTVNEDMAGEGTDLPESGV